MYNLKHLSTFALLLTLSLPALSDNSARVWEYKAKTLDLLGDKVVTNALNALGNEKWELVNCTGDGGSMICIFKRPKP